MTGSGASRNRCSAGCPSGSRLVASTVEVGAAVHERGDDVPHGGQQVLAVVDHEQLWPGGEERGAGREDIAVHDVQVERRGECLGDGGGVGDRREEHDGDLVGSGRDLGCQGGFADTARAEHGHQALVGEQPLHRGQLGVPAPKPARGAGQRARSHACPAAMVRSSLLRAGEGSSPVSVTSR